MTPSNANTSGLYLLMKRGLYYRPDAMGYTGIKDHAGRYSKDDAEGHADPASGVSMVSEADAAEFSPNCFADLARAHLLKQRDAAEARADRLAKALERAADDLRDIGMQKPQPTNSPDPEHENYLRRVLISLGQVGNTRARAALQQEG